MRWALSVYAQGIRIAFRTMLAYRANFVLSAVLSILNNLGLPLVTVLIYGAGGAIPGWNVYEALLIQSVFMMCTGLSNLLFFSMVWITMDRVREGTFDLLLIRPGSAITQTLATAFEPEGFGVFLGGLALFFFALRQLPAPGMLEGLLFVFLFVMGMAVMLGCVLILSATAFRWVGNSRLFEIFDSVTTFGRYPSSMYPKAVSAVISFILPVAMLGFFPASALLGGIEPAMIWAVIPCLLFLTLGIWLYQHMVKAYKSAGG